MTIVVAVKDEKEGVIYLAADTAGSNGWNTTNLANKKIFEANNIYYGFTTSYRMGQILQYHSEEITRGDEESVVSYLASKLIPMWRRVLKDNGYTTVNNNEESAGTFIVVVGGSIFTVHNDFSFNIDKDDYVAVGCGAVFAKGSLYTNRYNLDRYATLQAIETAKYFSNGCGFDTDIIEIKIGA
jgi:hypothetical protein